MAGSHQTELCKFSYHNIIRCYRMSSTSGRQPINNNTPKKIQAAPNKDVYAASLPLSRSVTLAHPTMNTNQRDALPLARSVSLTHPVLKANHRDTPSIQSVMKNLHDAPSNQNLNRLAGQRHCGDMGEMEDKKAKLSHESSLGALETMAEEKVNEESERTMVFTNTLGKSLEDENVAETFKSWEQQVGFEDSSSYNSVIRGIKITNKSAKVKTTDIVSVIQNSASCSSDVAKRGVGSLCNINDNNASSMSMNIGGASMGNENISFMSLDKNDVDVGSSIPENSNAVGLGKNASASVETRKNEFANTSSVNNGVKSNEIVVPSGNPENTNLNKTSITCSIDHLKAINARSFNVESIASDLSEAREEPNASDWSVEDKAAVNLSKSPHSDSASLNIEADIAKNSSSSKGNRGEHILPQPLVMADKQAESTSTLSVREHEETEKEDAAEVINGFADLVSVRHKSK
jgi:hypothetical protein